jgi:phosphocarrier protein
VSEPSANAGSCLRRQVVIVNKRGLHARASAKLVGAVAELPDTVKVQVAKDGNEAAGGSILGLMMLGAATGDTIEDAENTLDRICLLVEDGFGEE